MSQTTLEERVANLEQQVAQLLAGSRSADAKKDWRKTIGMFSGDAAMKEIQEEGRKIREADREQAKRDHP
jgi:phage shock protein A